MGDIQLEEVRDQRIRREMRHRCSVSCVLPAGHEGLHMRQDGTRRVVETRAREVAGS